MLNLTRFNASLVAIVQKRAEYSPHLPAFRFFKDGEKLNESLTCGELDSKARLIAGFLQSRKCVNQRVLLIYAAGCDFIAAFMGCLYAGVTAIPIPAPADENAEKQLHSIQSIADDAEISGILCTSDLIDSLHGAFKREIKSRRLFLQDSTVLSTSSTYAVPKLNDDTLCYLQYTSGSTSNPKAVIITQGNLTATLKNTLKVWKYNHNSITLAWAPHTHVYGLICGLLIPLYHGTPCIILSPLSVIQKPLLWLKAMTDWKVTHSGCPNFGYELCVKHIDDKDIKTLNLSHWKVAINGGDKVQAVTLKRFAEKFKNAKFHEKAFNSAYGMSEVTGAIAVTETYKSIQTTQLTHQTQHLQLVSSGHILPGLNAKIVDVALSKEVEPGTVGEVWLQGKAVAKGYWNRPQESKTTFQAKLIGSDVLYFKTGDLGFMQNKQLFLTGRLKDLIIIHGKKYYPQDIENNVIQQFSIDYTLGVGICFSLPSNETEDVIFIQEVAAIESYDVLPLQNAIQKYLRSEYGIHCNQVLLTSLHNIAKTPSGKIQRKKTEELFNNQKIVFLTSKIVADNASVSTPNALYETMQSIMAETLSLKPDAISLNKSISDYGFDSIKLIRLSNELNKQLALTITPAELFGFETIADFYAFLTSKLSTSSSISSLPPVATQGITHDIAIIGMDGRFPNAETLDAFWQHLLAGEDAITTIPRERWDGNAYHGDPFSEDKSNSKWGGFINDMYAFDADFFHVSPHEASLMDPQHRIFLQSVWHCIEHAGYAVKKLTTQKVGLFVGLFNHDYAEILNQHQLIDAYSTTGIAPSLLANRISFLLNFSGPSEMVDTACSSSLVAIHRAVQAIQMGDCEVAIAGGVNALLTPTSFISASKAGMLSPDGHCKTFDESADGFVRSEGVGAILLKPLQKAIADKDTVWGVIKGSAVNHGGHANSLTAPNPSAQADVIMQAYRRAKVPVRDIDFIETHGTGTQLGDPVEVNGLKLAFETLAREQDITLPSASCGLATLKSHIGHLESAAGIASVIKILLAMKHQLMPSNLHFKQLNPYVGIEGSPFYIVNDQRQWPLSDVTNQQLAGISSFGFGGANSHLLLASGVAVASHATNEKDSLQLFALSAKSEESLKQKVRDLHTWLMANPNTQLSQLAYTLNVRRDHFDKRLVILASSFNELMNNLSEILEYQQLLNGLKKASATHFKYINEMELYLKGENIAWQLLYGDQSYAALPVTGYPFARTHFGFAYLSDRLFDAHDYLIAEHRIQSQAMLPGAALVEWMVNALSSKKSIVMNQVKWLKPFIVKDISKTLHLSINKHQSVSECIISENQTVIARASISSNESLESIVNVADIQNRLTSSLDKKSFYAAFKQKDCHYGPHFQVLESVHFSESESLAYLRLPFNHDAHLYQHHPVMLDGILHSAFAVLLNQAETLVPQSVEQIIFHHPLPSSIWVHAVKTALDTVNITAMDEQGNILVECKQVQLIALSSKKREVLNYFSPQWVAAETLPKSVELTTVIVIENEGACSGLIQKNYPNALIRKLSHVEDISKETMPSHLIFYMDNSSLDVKTTFKPVFDACKKMINVTLDRALQIIVVTQFQTDFCDALSAFFKSVSLENSKLQGSVVTLANLNDLPKCLLSLSGEVKIDKRGRVSRKEYALVNHTEQIVRHFKPAGKYLLTGGMGQISQTLSQYIAAEFQPTLILLGRTLTNPQIEKHVSYLNKLGAKAQYYSVDITDQKNLSALIKRIEKKIGHLDGVIHAAGNSQDALLINKTWSQALNVTSPKIAGLINIDKLTQAHDLDFFVTFSSAAGVIGNAGQSDYAYANAFMDSYTHSQNISLKTDRYLSINWPHWQEGGFALSKAHAQAIFASTGLTSLSTQDGITGLLYALSLPVSQVTVFPGDTQKQLACLNKPDRAATVGEHRFPTADLKQLLNSYLIKLISAATEKPQVSISLNDSFETLGIDSVMVLNLNQKLGQHFQDLPKTIFYEYSNLHSLANYLLDNHTASLITLFNLQAAPIIEEHIGVVENNVKARPSLQSDDIAIIGLSGRYPGANTLAEFWQNLSSGKDSITELPEARKRFANATQRAAGFISDIDLFDASFFNIAPRDAEKMDPQERLFLETAWSTLEDAAYTYEDLSGKNIGVYVGVMYGHYELLGENANSVFSSIPNRVSYHFNLRGPSLALDTMCSSSLTALHLACQSLKAGDTEMALVGGVNVSLHSQKFNLLEQGGFLSSNDRCMSFGEGGDGYVPGEGVGAVLLKPLSQAIEDKDHVYGVIKASALNHGGKTNGFTVPNPQSQFHVIQKAYESAGLHPDDISYIEAHGTGTSLGDPIEIEGLTKWFKTSTRKVPCAIGSVKSNIGHCESAAGMAAITKVLLQMQHQQLVPSLHAEQQNPNIHWESVPFAIQKTLSLWEVQTGSRLAGISSFGAGGSNAHVVIEESIPPRTKVLERSFYLFTLSAKQSESLSLQMIQFRDWLIADDKAHLADISYTLNRGRNHFDLRCAIVAKDKVELIEILNTLIAGERSAHASLRSDHLVPHANKHISNKVYQPLLQALDDQACSDADCYEMLVMFMHWYVDGYELPWSVMYARDFYTKLSMPTYAFQRESFWVGQTPHAPIKIVNVDNISIEDILKNIVVKVLKLPKNDFSMQLALVDLGFESLSFKEFANEISTYFATDFSPTLFYTYSSLADVARFLNKQSHTMVPKAISVPASQEDVAIIGMHGLFPQSDDVREFWEHLIAGEDLVTDIPAERWDAAQYYSSTKEDKTKSISKWAGFLKSVKDFDAEFFNLSAREANLMDPQQRLLLEVVWKTLEDAGKNPFTLVKEKVGVFIGAEFNEYQTLIMQEHTNYHGSIATGNSHSMLPNRVSYFFDFKGPSEAIDTACSSSLVAIHRAVQSIRLGECTYAIAGGVSLLLNPDTLTITSQLGALSSEGRCKTFDARANGYVKGEGVATLLLKPLSAAIKDNDSVYGVIKGSAVNHGGKTQSLTAPSVLAQSELLINAYSQAAIDPSTISYMEVHGTGTELGDPIEIDALKTAFKHMMPQLAQQAFCGLGALKSQIGHLEPASGVASVIKVLMAMHHNEIPANLHCQELNPYIDLTNSPFYLINEKKRWDRLSNHPRRAGVSSFGFGGSNAHVIIEESLSIKTESLQQALHVVCLSAKKAAGLVQKVNDLLTFLKTKTYAINLQDLAYTLNTGRAHFELRCVFVVDSLSELQLQLQAYLNNSSIHVNTKVHPLANAYLQGQVIVWDEYYDAKSCQKIHLLPAYPFEKKSYWFSQSKLDKPVQIKVINVGGHKEQVIEMLASIFSDVLSIAADEIEPNQTYEVYGVDSVMGLEITQRLEKIVGSVSKTLLYERNTLNDLAQYLLKHHAQALSGIVEKDEQVKPITSPIALALTPLTPQNVSHDIAIIGMTGSYPGAETMTQLWDNLVKGKDCVTEIPTDRWQAEEYVVKVGGKDRVFNQGGFIPDIDKFDPLFFGIAPNDAALMDPQERLFLQSGWATMEDAGYTRERLQRYVESKVGVFVGVTYNFYPLFIAEEWAKGNRIPLDIQLFSVANRLSYFLNAKGPSLVIDTACSSSLAAIHQACESIQRGECKMALAGGVNLSLHPSKYHMLGSMSFLAEDGRCRSFGEGGVGYVPAEGVGSVLLKPLSLAEQHGDRILGVIKASSMNHGGKTSGYTVPNPSAQAQLIQDALSKAAIPARSISYIEAHGTGTALGDPIEVRGLQEAFEQETNDLQFCALGSIKSNIGHAESAAGISQLSKVLLQFQHKKIVASLHSASLNPFIDFNKTAFYVPQATMDWQPQGVPRRAGISSFGAGGTNVHVILEEYAQHAKKNVEGVALVFLLSAANEERLRVYLDTVSHYCHSEKAIYKDSDAQYSWLQSLCYTLQVGREAMGARLAFAATSVDAFFDKLNAIHARIETTRESIWQPRVVKIKHKTFNTNELELVTDYQQLVSLWMDGHSIAWETFYVKAKPSLLSLPTYPYAKRHCWIASQPKSTEDKTPTPQSTNITNPFIPVASQPKWLIFSEHEVGAHLIDLLGRENCILVFPAESYSQFSESVYYINPNQLSDYQAVLAAIPAVDHIAYLWGQIVTAEEKHKQFLLIFQALTSAQFKRTLLFSYFSRANEQDEILLHHLWNLQSFFAESTSKIDVLFLENLSASGIRSYAQHLISEHNNYRSDVNHLIYDENEIRRFQLTNPQRFQQEMSVPSQASIFAQLDKDEILMLVLNALSTSVGLTLDEIDPDVAFLNYGMDSIIGINFVADLNKVIGELLSPMDLYRYPAVTVLVDHIAKSCAPCEKPVVKSLEEVFQSEQDFAQQIAHLSDADIAALLEAELAELNLV